MKTSKIIALILLVFVLLGYIFNLVINKPEQFFAINSIDNLYLNGSNDINVNSNYVIADPTDTTSLAIYKGLTKNIELPITLSGDNYSVYNPFTSGNFDLGRDLTQDSQLSIKYDPKILTLDFYLPNTKYDINGNTVLFGQAPILSVNLHKNFNILKSGNLVIWSDVQNDEADQNLNLSDIYGKNLNFYENKNSVSPSYTYNFEVPNNLAFVANNVYLNHGDNGIELADQSNLLGNGNYSFEEGLWDSSVGSCDPNIKGDPKISMKLVSNDSSDGNNSLELSSENALACTSQIFNVNADTKDNYYKFLFDYKNLAGSTVLYQYNLIDTVDNEQTEVNLESTTTTDEDWHTLDELINTNLKHISQIQIFLFSEPNQKDKNNITLFDNLRVLQVARKDLEAYSLSENNTVNSDLSSHLSYTKTGKYQYDLDLKSNNPSPIIYMTEKDPGNDWQMTVQNSSIFNTLKNFFKSNTFVNNVQINGDRGWILNLQKICSQDNNCKVNQDGSYTINLIITYTPQTFLTIFGLVLLVVVPFLFLDLKYKARRSGKRVKIINQSFKERLIELSGAFLRFVSRYFTYTLRLVLIALLGAILLFIYSPIPVLFVELFLVFLLLNWDIIILGQIVFLFLLSIPFFLALNNYAVSDTVAMYMFYLLMMFITLQIKEIIINKIKIAETRLSKEKLQRQPAVISEIFIKK